MICMVVTCRSQPVIQWMHGTRSVAVIGRYKQEIVKEGDGYAIVLKVDQVGLISMMSSHAVSIYVYLQPHPTPEIYCSMFFVQPSCVSSDINHVWQDWSGKFQAKVPKKSFPP